MCSVYRELSQEYARRGYDGHDGIWFTAGDKVAREDRARANRDAGQGDQDEGLLLTDLVRKKRSRFFDPSRSPSRSPDPDDKAEEMYV